MEIVVQRKTIISRLKAGTEWLNPFLGLVAIGLWVAYFLHAISRVPLLIGMVFVACFFGVLEVFGEDRIIADDEGTELVKQYEKLQRELAPPGPLPGEPVPAPGGPGTFWHDLELLAQRSEEDAKVAEAVKRIAAQGGGAAEIMAAIFEIRFGDVKPKSEPSKQPKPKDESPFPAPPGTADDKQNDD